MKKCSYIFFAVVCLLSIMLAGCSTSSTAQHNSVATTQEESQKSVVESSQESKTESKSNPPPTMDGDFRYSNWGMSKEQVKQSEVMELVEQGDYLVCLEEKILGMPVQIVYQFDNDKFCNAGYMFKQNHSEKLMYYEDYQKVVKSYTDKYGEPTEIIENWRNTLYKDRPEDLGRAIAAGHVNFVTKWTTNASQIAVGVSGDNYKISLTAVYQALDYEAKTNTDGI